MKSSTVHKPNISKERIAALEELLSDRSVPYDSSPGVYVRSDKDRELDILWQGFKVGSKDERSPGVYLSIGFVTGAICMFLMTTILNLGNPVQDNFSDLNLWKKANTVSVKDKVVMPGAVSVSPASTTSTTASSGSEQSYKVVAGDSLASIAIKFYGSSAPDKIQKIQDANGMSDPNKLALDQVLRIPAE